MQLLRSFGSNILLKYFSRRKGVLGTPSYISIETSSGLILQLMNYSFKEEECFFQLIDEEVQETNIDWEQRRYEIVKDYSANWKVALDTKEICERLVKFADKLIKQLKIKTCQQTH